MRAVVMAVLVIALAVPATLNLTGYCWQEGRYLSDRELVHAFANDAANNLRSSLAGWEVILRGKTGEKELRIIEVAEYASADELLAVNPDCCVIGRLSEGVADPLPYPDLFKRITGYANKIMTSAISIVYVDEHHIERVFVSKSHSWIDACGDIKLFKE